MITAIINLPPKGKARPRLCKGRTFMPKDYTDWKKEFGRQWLAEIKAPTMGGLLHVSTYFATKTGNCRSDMDNAHASVLDALQDCGAIVNDRIVKSGQYALSKGSKDEIVVIIRQLDEPSLDPEDRG